MVTKLRLPKLQPVRGRRHGASSVYYNLQFHNAWINQRAEGLRRLAQPLRLQRENKDTGSGYLHNYEQVSYILVIEVWNNHVHPWALIYLGYSFLTFLSCIVKEARNILVIRNPKCRVQH